MTTAQEARDMEQITVGTKVSYEDMANPRRYGTVTALVPVSVGGIAVAPEYRIAWQDGSESTSDCRQRGWRVEEELPTEHSVAITTSRRASGRLSARIACSCGWRTSHTGPDASAFEIASLYAGNHLKWAAGQ